MSESKAAFLEKTKDDKQKDAKDFLPLGIDISRLKCLIIGAGRIALRKVKNLLKYNADITIISPDISDGFLDIIDHKNIKYIKDYYSSPILESYDFIIAATSDKQVNCQIAHDAKAKGKFCCIASSAKHSNVIFPAIYSQDGITVAVHSNGKNCLKSKYTKNKIADLLNGTRAKQLILAGVSYDKLPANISTELDGFTKYFDPSRLAYKDIAVISTCQRWECVIYGNNPNETLRYLFDLIKNETKIELSKYADFIYSRNNIKAFHHLIRLAAGLDSNLIGETEIVAQLNSMIDKWLDNDSKLRSILELVMLKARKIRNAELSDLQKNSWSTAAVSFLKEKIKNDDNFKISIKGKGAFVDNIKNKLPYRLSNQQGCKNLIIDLNPVNNKENTVDNYYTIDDIADSTITVETAVCKVNAEKKAVEQSLLWHSSTEQIAIPTEPIWIGLRSSRLSMAQFDEILPMLEILAPDIKYSVHKFSSPGDRDKTTPLPKIEQQDLFTKDIDDMLLSYNIDLAIHSVKDLPDKLAEGLCIAAVTPSISPWDCLVSREALKLSELPSGAKVGTSSQRRAEQIKRLRPDIEVADIRGNVPDRIDQMDKGRYDAIILASVGLIRLGLADRIAEIFPVNKFAITPGQGSLALVIRRSDKILNEFLSSLDLSSRRGL